MEQPGVNAPGTAKRITVFPLHNSDILILLAGVFSNKSTLGTASPICKNKKWIMNVKLIKKKKKYYKLLL